MFKTVVETKKYNTVKLGLCGGHKWKAHDKLVLLRKIQNQSYMFFSMASVFYYHHHLNIIFHEDSSSFSVSQYEHTVWVTEQFENCSPLSPFCNINIHYQ